MRNYCLSAFPGSCAVDDKSDSFHGNSEIVRLYNPR